MKIALIGDIGLFGRHTDPNFSVEYFSEIAPVLADFDLVLGNLETPFAGNAKRTGAKSAYISAPDHCLEILKMLNISAVSLANNHMFDFGQHGYARTKALLDDAGIHSFGDDASGLQLRIGGENIRILGACAYDTNPNGLNSGDICSLNYEHCSGFIQKCHDNGEFPIISAHYGIEHISYPPLSYQNLFQSLTKAGAYILHGHHPHVFQPVERIENSLLAYSLGNFCFDDIPEVNLPLQDINRVSGMVSIGLNDQNITSWDVIPTRDAGNILKVGDSVATQKLQADAEMFEENRNLCEEIRLEQRQDFVNGRKELRNSAFYLARLRPRYFKMMWNAIANEKKNKSNLRFE